MARSRSPGHPSISLPDAINRIRKVHDADRRNPIDRSVVASHLGYSGLSGASDTAISALIHYGLLEKVTKGEVKVSQLAIDILYPDNRQQRQAAIKTAAFTPSLFAALKERFPDDRFSDSALRSYLIRLGFVDSAVEPAIRAYMATCQFLEQEAASGSGGDDAPIGQESDGKGDDRRAETRVQSVERQDGSALKKQNTDLMADERILTTGLLSRGASFRLIVNGHVGVKEIERLIKKLELDKEILADGDTDSEDE